MIRFFLIFFFTDTATPEFYTLSLHDALPISVRRHRPQNVGRGNLGGLPGLDELDRHLAAIELDRKSTRLNSSHVAISYAVFCLKKKKKVLRIRHIGIRNDMLSAVDVDLYLTA